MPCVFKDTFSLCTEVASRYYKGPELLVRSSVTRDSLSIQWYTSYNKNPQKEIRVRENILYICLSSIFLKLFWAIWDQMVPGIVIYRSDCVYILFKETVWEKAWKIKIVQLVLVRKSWFWDVSGGVGAKPTCQIARAWNFHHGECTDHPGIISSMSTNHNYWSKMIVNNSFVWHKTVNLKKVPGLRPPHILIIIFGLSKSSYAYFKGSGTGASPRDNDDNDNDDNDNKIFVMTYSCAIIAPRELCKPCIPLSDKKCHVFEG